ncbi:hypothetical protein NDU88_003611 [Pleurodeles waltl]|uniref:Uncharacterized protein n=1 Tax=Pleurodeles waltl TaxID=8319 RepID=A0AAV7V0H3_PLEWA|nr:hypothetical protein NDU88_003611 [Pleurodeles waltl]
MNLAPGSRQDEASWQAGLGQTEAQAETASWGLCTRRQLHSTDGLRFQRGRHTGRAPAPGDCAHGTPKQRKPEDRTQSPQWVVLAAPQLFFRRARR